jgi:hypothetical protein
MHPPTFGKNHFTVTESELPWELSLDWQEPVTSKPLFGLLVPPVADLRSDALLLVKMTNPAARHERHI